MLASQNPAKLAFRRPGSEAIFPNAVRAGFQPLRNWNCQLPAGSL